MKSKTLHPFCTTNLVVVGATNGAGEYTYSDVFACGDALHLDPGCSSQVYAEVRAISSVCFFENCSPIFMPTKFYTYVLADENPPWISQHMHSVLGKISE